MNEEEIPSDYDGLKANLYVINLSDKTEYDEKSVIMVSDLIDIIEKIRNLAPKYMNSDKQNGFTKDFQNFLKKEMAQSKGRDREQIKYVSLLNGWFKIAGEVVRIELRADRDEISNKAFDLSSSMIENLITPGENDTRYILDRLNKEKDK